MLRRTTTLVVSGVAVFVVACGLDVVGAALPVADAGSDATPATPPPVCDPTSCEVAPSGWAVVAVASAGEPCPSGWGGGQTDLRAEPSPRPGACTCGCSVTTPPSCVRGAIGGDYDTNGSVTCGLASTYAWANTSSGVCDSDMWPGPFTTSHDWKFAPPSVTGGACGASAEKHLEEIDFGVSVRACAPTPGCCVRPVAPLRQCIVADGDLACPAGPFTERKVLAKSFDLSCAAGCACSVTATCTARTVTFFAGAGCTGASFSMPVDGACHKATGTGGVASYRYAATVTGASCQTSGASSVAGVTFSGPTTVCCR